MGGQDLDSRPRLPEKDVGGPAPEKKGRRKPPPSTVSSSFIATQLGAEEALERRKRQMENAFTPDPQGDREMYERIIANQKLAEEGARLDGVKDGLAEASEYFRALDGASIPAAAAAKLLALIESKMTRRFVGDDQ